MSKRGCAYVRLRSRNLVFTRLLRARRRSVVVRVSIELWVGNDEWVVVDTKHVCCCEMWRGVA